MPFRSDRAKEVLKAHAWLITEMANGALPAWFTFLMASVRLVPLCKGAEVPGVPREYRPIGISCALRRAWTRCILHDVGLRARLLEFLAPTQLGVFMPDGGVLLVGTIREALDANPDFALVTIDITNAFNALDRARAFLEISACDAAQSLLPFLHAFLGPKTRIYGGGGEGLHQLPFDSEQGAQQGSVEGSLIFALATSEALKALDEELRSAGGGLARAGHDDVNAMATPRVLFPAVARFLARLRSELLLESNLLKAACFAQPAMHAELELYRGAVPVGQVVDSNGVPHRGVTVYGVPLGSDGYISIVLSSICDRIAGTSQKLCSSLGQSQLHRQALWILTIFSTNNKVGYWTRNCLPQHTTQMCVRVDALIEAQAAVALGCSPGADWLASHRLRLPVHLNGLGLPSALYTQRSCRPSWHARARWCVHSSTPTPRTAGVWWACRAPSSDRRPSSAWAAGSGRTASHSSTGPARRWGRLCSRRG